MHAERRSERKKRKPAKYRSDFHPFAGPKNRLRVLVNLNKLSDRAWTVLQWTQAQGFDQPSFHTWKDKVYAQILNRKYSSEEAAYAEWDDRIRELWRITDDGSSLVINSKFD